MSSRKISRRIDPTIRAWYNGAVHVERTTLKAERKKQQNSVRRLAGMEPRSGSSPRAWSAQRVRMTRLPRRIEPKSHGGRRTRRTLRKTRRSRK